ncbi:MAG: ATP-binding cassette domain-containing protein [Bacteroidetes bacterium]|nr:ATP-binding cassette domain-containing protein [Bacteroidota bacterium]
MKISLSDIGKRYNREWIFRHLSFTFEAGKPCAIIGHNGSGKSTLLQLIAGSSACSEGQIVFLQEGKSFKNENYYQLVSLSAPYLQLPDEMNVSEFFSFHFQFKPLLKGISVDAIICLLGLQHAKEKPMRYFSSGMLQRVKLAQAIFADTSVLLLDEPCTNLDEQGIALYHQLIRDYTADRVVIVSSNEQQEYAFCTSFLAIGAYKSF